MPTNSRLRRANAIRPETPLTFRGEFVSDRDLPPVPSADTVEGMKPKEPELDRYGFPVPHSFDLEGPKSGEEPLKSTTGPRIRFVLRMAIIAGLGVALWYHFDLGAKGRNVVGRHFAESALQHYKRKDFPGALAEAEKAVAWSPNDTQLRLIRGEMRRLNKDYQGCLADAEEVARQKPDDVYAADLRRQMYHFLHEHRKAAEAATEALTKGIGPRAVILNDRAYARAVGDFELDEALADIDEAIKLSANDNASFIDTRAYVLFRMQRYAEALKELDRAIMLTEEVHKQIEDLVGRGNRRRREDLAEISKLKSIEENLAVMYHHRAEIYEKQKKPTEAKRDFEAAAELGFNPAEGVY
jgi:predicted Zn-dependent protease